MEEPHTAMGGVNQGEILNLADRKADPARRGVLSLTREKPEGMMQEAQRLLVLQLF